MLATVFRSPPTLVFNRRPDQCRLPVCGDPDDVFFDTARQRIYVSCGAGEIAVFQLQDRTYHSLTWIATASGVRTSLFVPELDRLFVAQRAGLLGSNASVRVYRPVP